MTNVGTVCETVAELAKRLQELDFDCDGTRKQSVKILMDIMGVSYPVAANDGLWSWLETHGGFCDCEILRNVLVYGCICRDELASFRKTIAPDKEAFYKGKICAHCGIKKCVVGLDTHHNAEGKYPVLCVECHQSLHRRQTAME